MTERRGRRARRPVGDLAGWQALLFLVVAIVAAVSLLVSVVTFALQVAGVMQVPAPLRVLFFLVALSAFLVIRRLTRATAGHDASGEVSAGRAPNAG